MVEVGAATTNDYIVDFGGNTANEHNPLVQYIARGVTRVLTKRIVLESNEHCALYTLLRLLRKGGINAQDFATECGSCGILDVNLGSGDSRF